ncbi:VOC family protein [Bradyrhizobium erythrophlei]|jgi:uncharacterized glyoxalase superfamily protein PhnB|uniref:Uncharacterized conserved protein PhnB, glyoxalase superfamily n=1 Tax=Bradyrhizobium erythrophlei TaxID=1437360 RepID=A0A1M5TZI7_9BRAD|nr:VOC family protein [Bradyrhizobium erythrophlei]SHH56118.1 Uncharacterized conserved protein PhnB, glyoxalase superfamily [Bradyrhizobium erythrophlei]
MLQASLNGMLIDWERAGPERRFEVRVPNVLQAGKFYRGVFGADETFRQETHNGKVFRLGFTIGRIGFAISSEGDIERPLLSSIAEEFGSAFVAVILRVEDPDCMARAAQQAGSGLTRAHQMDPVTVVTDPFGGHWALVKREPVP